MSEITFLLLLCSKVISLDCADYYSMCFARLSTNSHVTLKESKKICKGVIQNKVLEQVEMIKAHSVPQP